MNNNIDILDKKINNLLDYTNAFVKKAVDDEIETEIALFNGAYCHEKIVALGLISKLNENDIDNFHKEYYEFNFPDLFHENYIEYETFALFHEVGHIMTFNPRKEKKYQKQVRKIKKRIEKNNNTMTAKDLVEYFTIKNEINADLWAYNFISENLQIVKYFQNNFMKLINEILDLAK